MKLSTLIPFWTAGWNPARGLHELESQLGEYLAHRARLRERTEEEAMEMSDWSPSVDVSEDEFQYLVTVDLPGLKKEEVRVTITSGELVISGERQCDKEVANRKFHRTERKYGTFRRTFRLPDSVMKDKVNAEMTEGVLVIHLPKGETARPLVSYVSIT